MLKAAHQYFGFANAPGCQGTTADAMEVARHLASGGAGKGSVVNMQGPVEVLVVDVNSSDSKSGMSCPPEALLSSVFLTDCRNALSPNGVCMFNVSSLEKDKITMACKAVAAVFPAVYYAPTEVSGCYNPLLLLLASFKHSLCAQGDDVNVVLYGLGSEAAKAVGEASAKDIVALLVQGAAVVEGSGVLTTKGRDIIGAPSAKPFAPLKGSDWANTLCLVNDNGGTCTLLPLDRPSAVNPTASCLCCLCSLRPLQSFHHCQGMAHQRFPNQGPKRHRKAGKDPRRIVAGERRIDCRIQSLQPQQRSESYPC